MEPSGGSFDPRLDNPMDLSQAFKTWLLKYIELHPPSLPLAQMLGAGNVLDGALAVPVLRAEAGGSLLGGAAAGSYITNMDGTPIGNGVQGNFVESNFMYDSALDAPPAGYKTQWQQAVTYQVNATAPAITFTWALWQQTASAGGAGGYTSSGAASFAGLLNCVAASPAAGAQAQILSGWSDHGAASGLATGNFYAFAVNLSGAPAANSALRWRARLYRRFVPAS